MRRDLTWRCRRAGSPPRPPRRGASRTASQDGKPLAQAQEGDVAVAVVRRLREDGQDELVERVAVGRHDRHAVDVAQALAHRAHAARRRRGPGRRRRRGRHGRAAPERRVTHGRVKIGSDRCRSPASAPRRSAASPSSGARRTRRPGPSGRRSSTSTASRRARTTGCPSCAAPAAWRPTSRASGARASAGTATSRWPATTPSSSASSTSPASSACGSSSTTGARSACCGPSATPSASSGSSSSTPSPSSPATAGTALARAWRTRGLGEVVMGRHDALRDCAESLPRELGRRSAWPHFDQGTQRAILRLYRSEPRDGAGRRRRAAGRRRLPGARRLGRGGPVPAAALRARLRGGARRPGRGRARARGAGHWPWCDRPEVADRVVAFLDG